MHPSQRACIHQQKRVSTHAAISDCYAFFNLLTGKVPNIILHTLDVAQQGQVQKLAAHLQDCPIDP